MKKMKKRHNYHFTSSMEVQEENLDVQEEIAHKMRMRTGPKPVSQIWPKPISLVRSWKIDNLNLLREQQTRTKMAATSDEEMESLLSAFDQIYEVLVKSDYY